MMTPFLQTVAQDIIQKVGPDLSQTVVVFPNKRAGLFFNKYLASQFNHPIWSPTYVTISDLFAKYSRLKKADNIYLVCKLYKIFASLTGSRESLDEFYFWGELLISDFDDADKNLVDITRLFTNLKDLHDLLDTSFLEPEQIKALKQFFDNYSIERKTTIKERFAVLWEKLGDIYQQFQEELIAEGLAYEGMLYRKVIDSISTTDFTDEHYVIVGFNVLNKVEEKLFRTLQKTGKALFYWDYDTYYTTAPLACNPPFKHEAGEFLLRNLKSFPNELPADCFDHLNKPKEITYISSPTENAQARYLPQWIELVKGLEHQVPAYENAVVLCNESLLQPVMHAIPNQVEHVNITMGFPLAQTPVASYIEAVIELQTEGYNSKSGRFAYQQVCNVLKHPYTRLQSPMVAILQRDLIKQNRFFPLPSELQQDEFTTTLFTPQHSHQALFEYLIQLLRLASRIYAPQIAEEESEESTNNPYAKEDPLNQLYRESVFKSYLLINRLLDLITSGNLEGISTHTLKILLRKVIRSSNIPFHGEPAIGLQIMGVLETRNLDFSNLLILSLNEGLLPKGEKDASFIPYNLRKAFGMTTVEHKNAVYAYYFYRLIQRAEHITLMYNSSTQGINRNEQSRFLLQLQTEWPHPIHYYQLHAEQQMSPKREICIEKTPEMMQKLRLLYRNQGERTRYLSPSALNTYLSCPLSFYFRYVMGMKEEEDVSSDIDQSVFGTLFHQAAEMIYKDLITNGKHIIASDLESLIRNIPLLKKYVDKSFKKVFFKIPEKEKCIYNGTQLINHHVLTTYLRNLLRTDFRYAPFDMVGMEVPVFEDLNITADGNTFPIRIGGIIDRMDLKGDILRIVDYKTGHAQDKHKFKDIDSLFLTDKKSRGGGYVFQLFYYASIIAHQHPEQERILPVLNFVTKAASDNYDPCIIEVNKSSQKVEDYRSYDKDFSEHLISLITEIFSQDIPFSQSENPQSCTYCPFSVLCRKNVN